jgi:hypothetical protein
MKTEPAAFDLSAFESAEFATLVVKAVNGQPLLNNGQPVTIEVWGPGSEVAAAAHSEYETALQAAAFAGLRADPGEAKPDTASLLPRKLAAVTKAIHNFPVPGGAAALYSNKKLAYITRQVQRFCDDWANFPPASTQG